MAPPIDWMKRVQIAELLPIVAATRGLPLKEPVKVAILDEPDFDAAFARHADEAFANDDGTLFGGQRPKDDPAMYLAFFDEYAHTILLRDHLPGWTAAAVAHQTEEKAKVYVEGVIAHEIVHAIQDQYFGLQKYTTDRVADRRRAKKALIEGDAEVTRIAFESLRSGYPRAAVIDALRTWDARDPETLGEAVPDALRAASRARREAVLFSYVQGARFVAEAWTRGGFPRVNALYDRGPERTSEVFHPERFFQGDARIHAPDLPPPEGYTLKSVTSFGELATRNFLASLRVSPAVSPESNYAIGESERRAAADLRGDTAATFVSLKGGQTSVVWWAQFANESTPERIAEQLRETHKSRAPQPNGPIESLIAHVDGTRLFVLVDVPADKSAKYIERLAHLAPTTEPFTP